MKQEKEEKKIKKWKIHSEVEDIFKELAQVWEIESNKKYWKEKVFEKIFTYLKKEDELYDILENFEFKEKEEKETLKKEDYESCLKVLNSFVKNPKELNGFKEIQETLTKLEVGNIQKKQKKEKKKNEKKDKSQKKEIKIINSCELAKKKEYEKEVVKNVLKNEEIKLIKNKEEEIKEEEEIEIIQKCYICKKEYKELHHFYDQLCLNCSKFNYEKRKQKGDLKGKIALITGGRIKIGYEIVLILLRNGCQCIVTSRFPKDTAIRYSKEKDFEEFKDRLFIYGLDLKHLPSVSKFIEFLNDKYKTLDILINNAAQTIRRPTIFYQHLIKNEMKELKEFDKNIQMIIQNDFQMKLETKLIEYNIDKIDTSISSHFSQIKILKEDFEYKEKEFPKDRYDTNHQQIDLRKKNTWTYQLNDISLIELLECQTINSTSPFLLIQGLSPLMMKNKNVKKWIINVSAMEGSFNRKNKTIYHVHTNMAKASLNMLTRTTGTELAKNNIYMNSVDTGWVTDEYANGFKTNFRAPLDEIDGAQRCLDPIFQGINLGIYFHSKFLKDYKEDKW